MASDYRKEFPDFGDMDVQIPPGFVDNSDSFEFCPSFQNDDLGLRIYVDYQNPAQRDRGYQRDGRFMIIRLADDKKVVDTNDWAEVIEFIRESVPSNVVRLPTNVIRFRP